MLPPPEGQAAGECPVLSDHQVLLLMAKDAELIAVLAGPGMATELRRWADELRQRAEDREPVDAERRPLLRAV